jgi:hypothetical protein
LTPLSADRQNTIGQIFQYIQTITNIHFVFIAQDNLSNQIGDITFGFGSRVSPLDGFTFPDPLNVSGFGGDVWLKTGLASPEFFLTALHEIGHALGLSHPSLPPGENTLSFTVMAPPGSGNPGLPNPSTYMVYDIAELQFLYGAGANNPGDDVYSFGGTTNVRMTIWDTGGTNEISAATATQGASVNLNQTKFSSIIDNVNYNPGHPADNIAITLGTVIQNATGSSKDDILTGNDVGNRIYGGDGKDLIFGDETVTKRILSVGPHGDWFITDDLGAVSRMSGLPTIADIEQTSANDRRVPGPDICRKCEKNAGSITR